MPTDSSLGIPAAADQRSIAWHWLVLALVCALVLANYLSDFGSLTDHEVLVGGMAHQMARDGTWGQLLIGDHDWLEKPPLPQWLAALSLEAFGAPPGAPEREWAVRLPSVLEGIAMVLLLAGLARYLYGPAVGLLAGLIATTMHGLFIYARLAEGEMGLCLTVVAGLAAAARALDAPPASAEFRRWRFLFWVAVGAANLIKGPLFGDLLMGGALFAYCLWQRDWRLPLRLFSPSGLAVAAALALAWPLWMGSRGELQLLLDQWIGDFAGRFQDSAYHDETPPWYYLEAIAGHLLPWSPLLLLALPLAWRRQREAARRGATGPSFNRERYLLCWVFAPIVLLSFATHRHHHYVLPMLPPQAILLAAALPALWSWLAAREMLRRAWLPLLLLAVAVGLAAAVLLLDDDPEIGPFALAFGLAGIAGTVALAAALRFGRTAMPAASALLALLAALFWVFGSGFIPRNDPSASDTAFLLRVDAQVPPEARLVLAGGLAVARFDFYIGRPAEGLWNPRSLPQQVEPGETLYVVTRGAWEPALEELGRMERLDRSPLSRFGPDPEMLYGLYRVEVAD
ncbi:MAG TPA: glycosyltransferase family 39 protein [Kiloniellales bacterium]|nr:glycosyltransferase family 39 protein [Kiloniellales bacterium]